MGEERREAEISNDNDVHMLWEFDDPGKPLLMWEHNGMVCILRRQEIVEDMPLLFISYR